MLERIQGTPGIETGFVVVGDFIVTYSYEHILSKLYPSLNPFNWQHEFGELVQAHRRFFCTVAFNIVLDYDAAEDIVHDAFIKAWSDLTVRSRQDIAALKVVPWFTAIVRNTARNYLLQRSRMISLDMGEKSWVLDLEANGDDQPEAVLVQAEDRASLRDLLLMLSEQQREVFSLHVLNNLSFEEVARRLGCAVGTARVRFYRAKSSFQDIVLAQGTQEDELRRWFLVYHEAA
jgi:RNA polymerase sigma-70 factor (ECF subfamily)